MKARTVILPFTFPRLSDAGAAQLVAALQTLCENVEHHYADQVHRYHRRAAQRHRGYCTPDQRDQHPF